MAPRDRYLRPLAQACVGITCRRGRRARAYPRAVGDPSVGSRGQHPGPPPDGRRDSPRRHRRRCRREHRLQHRVCIAPRRPCRPGRGDRAGRRQPWRAAREHRQRTGSTTSSSRRVPRGAPTRSAISSCVARRAPSTACFPRACMRRSPASSRFGWRRSTISSIGRSGPGEDRRRGRRTGRPRRHDTTAATFSAIRLIVEWHPALQEAAGYAADALPRLLLQHHFTLQAASHTHVARLDAGDIDRVATRLRRAGRPVELVASR